MSTKKTNWREKPRPDLYSDKGDGKLRQTLRLTKEENDILREASKLEKLSINNWAVRLLVRQGKRVIAAAPPPTPRKRVKKLG